VRFRSIKETWTRADLDTIIAKCEANRIKRAGAKQEQVKRVREEVSLAGQDEESSKSKRVRRAKMAAKEPTLTNGDKINRRDGECERGNERASRPFAVRFG
jgi:hypothetical protein